MSQCEYCGPGKKASSASNSCENCESNTYSTGGVDFCSACVGGHSEPGQSSCVSTPPGNYWDGTADIGCPAGTFSSTGASSLEACEPCGEGFYSITGSGYCSPCEAGTFTLPSQASCGVCAAGKISGLAAKQCTDCESGKFNNLVKQEACLICGENQGTNATEGRTFCECMGLWARLILSLGNCYALDALMVLFAIHQELR